MPIIIILIERFEKCVMIVYKLGLKRIPLGWGVPQKLTPVGLLPLVLTIISHHVLGVKHVKENQCSQLLFPILVFKHLIPF